MSNLNSKEINEENLTNVSGGTTNTKMEILNWLYNNDQKLFNQIDDPNKNIKMTASEYNNFKNDILYGRISFNSISDLINYLKGLGFELI